MKRLVGSRVDEYVFYNHAGKEDGLNPKTVLVRIILNVDTKTLALDLWPKLNDSERQVFEQALAKALDAGGNAAASPATTPPSR